MAESVGHIPDPHFLHESPAPQTPFASPPTAGAPAAPSQSPASAPDASAPASGPTASSRPSWLRRAALVLLIVCLPVLAGFGTKANWFSPVTGQLYTQEQYEAVRTSAFEEGAEAGYDDGFADGRSTGEKAGLRQGYANGRAAGIEDGRREGYDVGYEQGFYDGCMHPFDLLGTTRVMDEWDYEYGMTYVSYYTTSICN